MAVQNRRQQWLRGVLDLCVLAVVAEREQHGYAIAHRLADAGLGTVQGGTLYPVLTRLRAAGYLRARWEPAEQGPGRRYYALTEAGRALLAEQGAAWVAFTRATEKLINPGVPS